MNLTEVVEQNNIFIFCDVSYDLRSRKLKLHVSVLMVGDLPSSAGYDEPTKRQSGKLTKPLWTKRGAQVIPNH